MVIRKREVGKERKLTLGHTGCLKKKFLLKKTEFFYLQKKLNSFYSNVNYLTIMTNIYVHSNTTLPNWIRACFFISEQIPNLNCLKPTHKSL